MINYLVDYENVKNDGFEGVAQLSDENNIYVFYTDNSKTLTFDTLHAISESKANIDYQKVMAGSKNALDFQLSSYLGYLIGVNGDKDEYYIVTKDMGYKCLIDFWNKGSIKVAIVPNFKANKVINVQTLKEEAALDPDVQKIINNYKTKTGINNALVKKYGSTKGGEIYKSIKPFIKDKKGR